MFSLLYVHVCVTRTGWKTRPRPKTVILPIKKSNQIKSNQIKSNLICRLLFFLPPFTWCGGFWIFFFFTNQFCRDLLTSKPLPLHSPTFPRLHLPYSGDHRLAVEGTEGGGREGGGDGGVVKTKTQISGLVRRRFALRNPYRLAGR